MLDIQKIKRIIAHLRVKKLPQDIYIEQLRSLVTGEGMLHAGTPYLINHAIKNMPVGGTVIEIGSYGGLSTNLILYLLKKNNRDEKLFNCDPWIYGGQKESYTDTSNIDGSDDITCADFSKYVKESFIRSTKFLNSNNLPHSFHLTSDNFIEKYKQNLNEKDLFGTEVQLGEPISFAYIDGNHAYDFAKRDFENVDKHLMNSGFILFDDSMDDSPFGSTIFMKEMKAHKNYRLIDKNPNYLFQKLA